MEHDGERDDEREFDRAIEWASGMRDGRKGRGMNLSKVGAHGRAIGQTSRDQFAPVRAPDSDPDSTRPTHGYTYEYSSIARIPACTPLWRCTHRHASPSIFSSRCPCMASISLSFAHVCLLSPPLPPPDPRVRRHPTAKRYSSQKVALCRSVSRPPQKFHAYLHRRHHLFAPR